MRVIIAGAGKVGRFMAGDLQRSGHDVMLVEVDPDRVAEAQSHGEPSGVTWLCADACEVSELQQAHPETADVVAAVTGDDEDNLVISLLVKQQFGVPRVIARVNNPGNEWLFDESWGVDLAVSTPHLLRGLVEESVSVGSLVRLLSFEQDRARISEVPLEEGAAVLGRPIAEVDLPRDVMIMAFRRDGQLHVLRSDTVLRPGDEALVLHTDDNEPQVRELLVG